MTAFMANDIVAGVGDRHWEAVGFGVVCAGEDIRSGDFEKHPDPRIKP